MPARSKPHNFQKELEDLLQIDPGLKPVIEQTGELPLRSMPQGFEGLSKIIVGQLISRAAANAIWARIMVHVKVMQPVVIGTTTVEDLRALGLTKAKAETLQNLAQRLLNEPDFLSHLPKCDTQAAISYLTELKGIGPWTAEVYLLLCEGHQDMFPSGDMALRTAAGQLFFQNMRPEANKLSQYSERWRPHRSMAARLLWQYYAQMKNQDFQPL